MEGRINSRGYTIVEMMVVMSIIAVLGSLSLSSVYGARNEVYVRHAAEKLKADIRSQFVDSISVKTVDKAGGVCTNDSVAKMRAVKIPMNTNFTSYTLIDYCDDPATNWLSPIEVESRKVEFSREIGFSRPAKISFSGGLTAPTGDSNYVYLVYTSPFGSFYGTNYNFFPVGTWARNPKTFSYYSTDSLVKRSSDITVTIELGDKKEVFNITKNGNVRNN